MEVIQRFQKAKSSVITRIRAVSCMSTKEGPLQEETLRSRPRCLLHAALQNKLRIPSLPLLMSWPRFSAKQGPTWEPRYLAACLTSSPLAAWEARRTQYERSRIVDLSLVCCRESPQLLYLISQHLTRELPTYPNSTEHEIHIKRRKQEASWFLGCCVCYAPRYCCEY
jgi:hypothetical protein